MSTKLTRLAAVLLLMPLLILPGCQSRSQSSDVQFIEVSLRGEDGIAVDGNPTSLENLPETVGQVVDRSSSRVVIRVDCQDNIPMSRLHAVQRELRHEGLVNMSYRTGSGDELTLILPPDDLREQMKKISSRHFATLHVAESGSVTLDGIETGNNEIEHRITNRLVNDDKLIVSIDVDSNATYGDFIRAFGATKRANAPRIQLNDPS